MRDETLRDEAEHFYSHLHTLSGANELGSWGEYDLVLDIKQDETGFDWFYYYVSHSNQCLFWLQEHPITNFTQTIPTVGVQSLAHISMLDILFFITFKLTFCFLNTQNTNLSTFIGKSISISLT